MILLKIQAMISGLIEGNAMVSSKSVTTREIQKIKVAEARRILGISANKMASLISSGTLPYEQDPLDHRVKLVRRKDVDDLMRKSSHGK